ncbi:hypothetical protein Y032_0289g1499 [Ancylostoma ceylanicum]|uniref:Uncharacterized protein n=1 Tax=Ancylostoma ceylanicum TaxID=53326 RepID=A0A016S5V1_9BILA|nr:hypothetical protein Y032_0289g1499 [Ancylostoma ceylanicum]
MFGPPPLAELTSAPNPVVPEVGVLLQRVHPLRPRRRRRRGGDGSLSSRRRRQVSLDGVRDRDPSGVGLADALGLGGEVGVRLAHGRLPPEMEIQRRECERGGHGQLMAMEPGIDTSLTVRTASISTRISYEMVCSSQRSMQLSKRQQAMRHGIQEEYTQTGDGHKLRHTGAAAWPGIRLFHFGGLPTKPTDAAIRINPF